MKIEIISKYKDIKKSKIVKIKKKEDIGLLLGLINFDIIRDHITDIDLNGKLTFKVNDKKVSSSELRKILNSEKINLIEKNKKTSNNNNCLEKDENGRIIIHNRKMVLQKNKIKKKKINEKKNKKKKNKKRK